MREFLGICLRRAGHEVTFATSGRDALDKLRSTIIDVVVTDLRMPGEIDGLGLLHAITSGELKFVAFPGATPSIFQPEVILVTAFATADTAIAAMKQGAYDYLTKPFQVDEITAVIARAIEKRALVADNAALRDQLAGRARLANLLGKSRPMQKVFELIGKIHSARTSVLITGESGTGKELVARALHTEELAREGAVRRGQLRRDPERADRERAVRPQEGRVHRRGRRQERASSCWPTAARCSSTRSARCRRRCRSSSCACCRSARSSASAASDEIEVDVARDRGDEPDLDAEVARRRVSRGSLLPARGRADRAAAAAPAPRGYAVARRSTSCAGWRRSNGRAVKLSTAAMRS